MEAVNNLNHELPENPLSVPQAQQDNLSQSHMVECIEAFQNEARSLLVLFMSLSIVLFAVATILQMQIYMNIETSLAIFPIIFYETCFFFANVVLYFYNKCPFPRLLRIFSSGLDLCFWIVLAVYTITNNFSLLSTLAPLSLSTALSAVYYFKCDKSYLKCTKRNFVFARLVGLFLVMFIGLKVEGLADMSWNASLWPLWVGLIFLCLKSLIAFGLLLTSIVQCVYTIIPKSHIYSPIWLNYSLFGITGSITAFIFLTLNKETKLPYLPFLVFLPTFLILSIFLFNHNIEYFTFLLTQSLNFSTYRPVAQGSRQILNSISEEKVSCVWKFPLVHIERVTSTYFKPCLRKRIKRTVSQVHDELSTSSCLRSNTYPKVEKEKETCVEPGSHLRDFSYGRVEEKLEVEQSSSVEKKCTVCFEGEANAVILECGHGGICARCADVMKRGIRKCHICRGKIEKVVKIEVQSEKMTRVVGISK